MLGTKLLKRCLDVNPRINSDLGNGLTYKNSNRIEMYMNEVIRCASHSFPKGLHYVGYRPAKPHEQLLHLTRYYRDRNIHELAYSDFYHCVYEFTFEGKPLKPRFMQLPYIRRGGILRVRGASFVVSPVLEDIIFSTTNDQIYMPVTRAKLTYKKITVFFKVDGRTVSADVVHSAVFNIKRDDKNKNKVTTLIHYIVAKYGIGEKFAEYFGSDLVFGYEEIDTDTYPQDEWVICSSTGLKPCSRGYSNFLPPRIRIAVPRSAYTHLMASVIGGLFYVIDREADMVTPEHARNAMLWRRLLPRFIKTDPGVERKAMEEMNAHMNSLDFYVDDLVKRNLQKENIYANNIFDVFVHIMATFTDRTTGCDPADAATNKRLDTVRHLLAENIKMISKLNFKLCKMQGDRLTASLIDGVFDQSFPSNAIFKINHGHGEVSTLESATDNFLFGVTKSLIPQTKATRLEGASLESEMGDPAYAMHSSVCVVNTYLFITKSDPSARSTINHFMRLAEDGGIVIDERLRKELEDLDAMLRIR